MVAAAAAAAVCVGGLFMKDRLCLVRSKQEKEALKQELAAAQKLAVKHAACEDKLAYVQVEG